MAQLRQPPRKNQGISKLYGQTTCGPCVALQHTVARGKREAVTVMGISKHNQIMVLLRIATGPHGLTVATTMLARLGTQAGVKWSA